MRFGLSLARANPRVWPELAVAADELGYDSLWLPEHLVLPAAMTGSPYAGDEHPPVPPTTPVFDAPAYLAYLAGLTRQIRLGTWVYLLGLRHPFIGARAFATLDVVSGGRAEVGVGAGWMAQEWAAVDLPFATRGRRLDEAIGVCRRLWSEETIEHRGEFYDFDAVCFEPKPVQQPLPVLIGGESPRALRRAVEIGDGWLGMLHTPASAASIASRLRRDRPDAEFTISVGAEVTSEEDIHRFADSGVDRVIVAPWRRSSEAAEGIRRFALDLMSSC